MKRRRSRFFALLLVLCLVLASFSAVAQSPTDDAREPEFASWTQDVGNYQPGELLVRFRDGVASAMQADRMAQFQALQIRSLYLGDVQLYQVPKGRELEIAAQLSADPAVAYAEPNYVYHVYIEPNDPQLANQWAHTVMRSRQAWNISTGSAAVTIAIVDSGIDETHPDLSGKLVPGYDFWEYDADPHDENGHGTHVAGIAAASTNNLTGVAGLSWGAKIMPVRVMSAVGSGYNSDIVDGINWAWSHGADIINLSLGGSGYSQSMQDAVNAAHNAGTLVIAAMGNCRTAGTGCSVANPTNYPAAYNNVLAVAATGPSDVYSSFSQYGPHCDLAAPGGDMVYYHDPVGILSTMPTYDVYLTTNYSYYKNYDQLHGTSQAAPQVAGLAALIWSLDPGLTPDQVQAVMQATAADLGPAGRDDDYGHGRIDALAALGSLHPPVSDLRVTSAITSTDTLTATVAWTPPASAITVAVRYSLHPITQANWNSALLLKGDLPGLARVYTATVPYTTTTSFFALRWQDVAGVWADTSNSAFWPSHPTYLPLVDRQ